MTVTMRRRSLTVLTSLAVTASLMVTALPSFATHVAPTTDVGDGIIVSEAATSDTFTVVLPYEQPLDTVVTVTSGDISEVTVSPGTLTFTGGAEGNWATAQTVTVTGVDDDVTDGTTNTTITLTPDAEYGPTTVTASNTDDEVAGISLGAVSGTTTEAGGTATFTAVLDEKPTGAVTVSVTPSDASEVTASGPLAFTDVNWATPQEVTLTGVDDDVDDGDVNYTVDLAASGGGYAGVTAQTNGSTIDDDTAGVTVTPTTGLATSETETADTFTVVLNSEPTADVTIGVSSSDTTEATVDQATLTFTAGNWNTAQTVTVTGVNDTSYDGDIAYTIVLGAATSGDGKYSGIDPSDVTGTNTDNDNPAAPPAEESDPIEFTDLDGLSDETLDAIDILIEFGITKGTSETTFSPEALVSRWQMALFVSRQLTVHGVTLPDPVDQGFEDLDGLTQETKDAIAQITILGVTTGTTNTTYSPDQAVTRWQMALFMTRVLTATGIELPAGDGTEFNDIAGLDAATQVAIRQLAELGVVFGVGGDSFAPNEPVERWQMALFIVRTMTAAGVPTA